MVGQNFASLNPGSCKKFRTGIFELKISDTLTITIYRTDKIEREYRVKDLYYVENRIEWLNECTFKLTVIKIEDPIFSAEKVKESLGHEEINTIIEIYENGYKVRAVSSSDKTSRIQIIKKIGDI